MENSTRRGAGLRQRIEEKLKLLAASPFDPLLRTHKLKGQLSGAWSCTVEYDCRIIFNFVQNPELGEEEILLIDIGSHNEVY